MSQAADAALFQATSFIDIGQARRAVDVLAAALRADGTNVDLLAMLSRAHVHTGDDASALAAANAAQNLAGAPVLQAMLVLIRVANNRGEYHRVCELARSVVAQWPDVPSGHMAYALGLTRLATTDAERDLVRQAVTRALELGQRSPGLLLNAAWIESRLGRRDACLAYVDEGLAADPSNADLLKMRAWAVGSARYRASVMMGILAIDPFDQDASQSLDTDVEVRRLRLVRLVFVSPFLLALAVMIPPGVPRIVAIGLVTGFLALRAIPYLRFLRALPAPFVRTRWLGQQRTFLASVALTLVGTVLFALDLPVVGPAVMALGMVAWGHGSLRTLTRKADAEPAGSGGHDPLLETHADWMRSLATQTGTFGGLAALFGWQFLHQADAGAVAAPFFTVALLSAVAMLGSLTMLGWIGRRRAVTATIVSAVVFGLVGGALAVGGAIGVVAATTGDAAGRYEGLPPADRICRRGACHDLTPDVPTFPTPSPVPTVSIPTFDVPTFDVPTPDFSELEQ